MIRSRLNVTLYSSPFWSWHRTVAEYESLSSACTGTPAWAEFTAAAPSSADAPESKNFVLLQFRSFGPRPCYARPASHSLKDSSVVVMGSKDVPENGFCWVFLI